MKKISILLGLSLLAFAIEAGAQGINTNVNANVNANVNSNLEVKAGASATATAKQKDKATSSAAKSENTVSAAAREIRGWDEGEKQEFLATVKAHAELKSGQDLENFARGVMIKDENVVAVDADENAVEVRYKLPAKFLGIFEAQISAITNVSFETDRTGRGPKEVTVKFPWYAMFFSLNEDVRAEILETAIETSVETNAQIPRDNHYAQNGRTINLISNILKGIRAEIEAEAEVEVEAN